VRGLERGQATSPAATTQKSKQRRMRPGGGEEEKGEWELEVRAATRGFERRAERCKCVEGEESGAKVDVRVDGEEKERQARLGR
jgi:hypothetical protein